MAAFAILLTLWLAATIEAWSLRSTSETSRVSRGGAFDINAKLAEIRDDLQVIRWLLEDDGEEEEEEGPEPPA